MIYDIKFNKSRHLANDTDTYGKHTDVCQNAKHSRISTFQTISSKWHAFPRNYRQFPKQHDIQIQINIPLNILLCKIAMLQLHLIDHCWKILQIRILYDYACQCLKDVLSKLVFCYQMVIKSGGYFGYFSLYILPWLYSSILILVLFIS